MTPFAYCRGAIAAAMLMASPPANAEMMLSQVIVDLAPDAPSRGDIEVWNSGSERMYVEADPFRIEAPGTERESRAKVVDPEVAGLLVSPQRIVLSPGERRVIRVAALGPRSASDRVYRVAIRPVAGAVSSDSTAIKLLVGYDVLVLVRPMTVEGDLTAERTGRTLVIRNDSNTAQELFEGRQCNAAGDACRDLPARRLYPGNELLQALPYDTAVAYKSAIGSKVRTRTF